jgi:hypothetical protein
MSSIDERNEARAARFFDEAIVPLGRELRQQGVVFADVAPRRIAASYYTPVAPFSKDDFDATIGGEGEELANALIKVWAGRPFLHALARQLAELGATLEPPPAQTADISPFMYVMF